MALVFGEYLQNSITLITPTYARDYERFCLQRESIERCGIELPHVAVVNHEDMPRFQDVPYQRGLILISTRDVLPRRIERRRRLWGVRRRNPRRWFAGAPLHGWGIQQFIKLASPQFVQTEGIVCMDSDTVFIRPVVAEDFYARDGRLHLYETSEDVDAEMAEWLGRSMRFLGVKPTQKAISRFTHSPTVLHRQIVVDMLDFIEKRHGRHWIDAMLEFGMIMEYTTYGVFAKYVDETRRVAATPPQMSVYFWWKEQIAEIQKSFAHRVNSDGAKILAVQSNAGLDAGAYRALLEGCWDGLRNEEGVSAEAAAIV